MNICVICNDHLILSSHLRLGLPNGLFPSGFPTKTLCTTLPSSLRATCPAHLILLDFIARKILGDKIDWMELAQYRDMWRALVSTVKNFRAP